RAIRTATCLLPTAYCFLLCRRVFVPQLLPALAWLDELESDGVLAAIAPDGFNDGRDVKIVGRHADLQHCARLDVAPGVQAQARRTDLFNRHLFSKGRKLRGVALDARFDG